MTAMSYREPLPPQAIAAHDRQREFPVETWNAVLDPLVKLIDRERPCIDVGIGTGAVGLRLARRGLSVVGVDCNRSMLQALVVADPRLPIIEGDAVSLPLRTGSAGAVVMAYVLQLIESWQDALDEALRVLRPDGILA